MVARIKHAEGAGMEVSLHAACDAAAYGYAGLHFAEPLTFCGRAEHARDIIHLRGELTATLLLNCSRCGGQLPYRLQIAVDERYSNQAAMPDAAGESDIHLFSGDDLDITPQLLAALFLELPMQPLCRPECRGLCPLCGANLNETQCSCAGETIDPRWEKLKQLMSDESQKGV